MPTGQQYATNVPQTTLTASINAAAPSMQVLSATGWPAAPFTAILDIGTSSQEPVDVTAVVGTTFTITRAIDGTSAFSHGPGFTAGTVTHGDIGRDFREARTHMDGATNQHGVGVGNDLVGTGTAQNLSNKTIVAGTYSGTQSMGSGAWSGTGGLTEATLAFSGLTGAATSTTRFAGTVTGDPPTSGTFTTGDLVYSTNYRGWWICTAGGTPGTWAAVGRHLLVTSSPVSGTVTFSSIPANYSHLVVEYVARTSNAGGGGHDYITMQLNGSSSNNYTWRAYGVGQTGAGAPAVFTDGSTGFNTQMNCGIVWSSKFATAGSGRGYIEIPYYADTTFFKEIHWNGSSGDGTNSSLTVNGGGNYNASAGAVTSFSISTSTGSFLTGTTFKLYGVA